MDAGKLQISLLYLDIDIEEVPDGVSIGEQLSVSASELNGLSSYSTISSLKVVETSYNSNGEWIGEYIYAALEADYLIRIKTRIDNAETWAGFKSSSSAGWTESVFYDTTVDLLYLTWVDYTDCGISSANCNEEAASTLSAYKVHQMEYDGSFGPRVLYFLGETDNSSGAGEYTNDMRLDRLNLDKTDVSINTEQE